VAAVAAVAAVATTMTPARFLRTPPRESSILPGAVVPAQTDGPAAARALRRNHRRRRRSLPLDPLSAPVAVIQDGRKIDRTAAAAATTC